MLTSEILVYVSPKIEITSLTSSVGVGAGPSGPSPGSISGSFSLHSASPSP